MPAATGRPAPYPDLAPCRRNSRLEVLHVLPLDSSGKHILAGFDIQQGQTAKGMVRAELSAFSLRGVLDLFALTRKHGHRWYRQSDVGSLWSFCPQGLHGICRCCAAGRNKTGNQCSDAEKNGNRNECQPIRSPHAIEHATQIAGKRK